MGRHCSVCDHPDRNEIDRALVAGSTALAIAGNNGLAKSSVDRHRAHLSQTVLRVREVAEIARSEGLLAHAVALTERALLLLDEAHAGGDSKTALVAIREVSECLRLLDSLRPQPESGLAKIADVLAAELEPQMLRRVTVALSDAGL